MRLPIVVGTDLTEASDEAVIQAAARSTRDSVPLTVVHAVDAGVWGAPPDSSAWLVDAERVRERVMALTGRREASFEVIVVRAAPHLALSVVAEARGALLVVGSHKQRGIGHAFLRDVTARVVERARHVYVAKPMPGTKRILVALWSPLDDTATLDAAVEEARASASTLVVMHSVYMGFLATIATDLVNGGAYAEHPLGERSQVVRARHQLSAELARRAVKAELHIVDGEPESMIVETARRTDVELIVVGTQRAPAPLSHVANDVLKHAPCSVLVVGAVASSEATVPHHATV